MSGLLMYKIMTMITAQLQLPFTSQKSTIFARGTGTQRTAFNSTAFSAPFRSKQNLLFLVRSKVEGPQDFQKTRGSPQEVCEEIQKCYQLVHKLGRGVLYLGSSRTEQDHPHFLQAMELGREIAELLGCTSWTGAGPGLMDAVIKGALQAKKPVGGLKIAQEAGDWTNSNFHPYLPLETYLTCRFFSARKHGLVDAAVRNDLSDKTAIVGLPGGIGTFDEIFEILTLFQLKRIGSKHPVPFILMSYDGFYSRLLEFISICEHWGTVADGEVDSLWKVCTCNLEALEYLADFYDIEESKRQFRSRLIEACV